MPTRGEDEASNSDAMWTYHGLDKDIGGMRVGEGDGWMKLDVGLDVASGGDVVW